MIEFEEHKKRITDLAARMLTHSATFSAAALGGSTNNMNVDYKLLSILTCLEVQPSAPIRYREYLRHETITNLVQMLAYCQMHCCPFTEEQSEALERVYKKLEELC